MSKQKIYLASWYFVEFTWIEFLWAMRRVASSDITTAACDTGMWLFLLHSCGYTASIDLIVVVSSQNN